MSAPQLAPRPQREPKPVPQPRPPYHSAGLPAPLSTHAAAHFAWGSAHRHPIHHPRAAAPSPDTSSEPHSQTLPPQGPEASYPPVEPPNANLPVAPSPRRLRRPRAPATATPPAQPVISPAAGLPRFPAHPSVYLPEPPLSPPDSPVRYAFSILDSRVRCSAPPV